jgi:hypothetical protein
MSEQIAISRGYELTDSVNESKTAAAAVAEGDGP